MTPSNDPTTPTDPVVDPAKPATPSGAPDAYTFTPPEGITYDKSVLDAATPIFRELNLPQAAADKLVEFWNTQAKSQADVVDRAIAAQGEKWMTEVKSDPDIGPKLEQISADIGRMYDTFNNPKLVSDFKLAMNASMVGNNPAFIKVLHALAQSRLEGKPVTAGGPSPNGQSPTGKISRPSLAQAMYPNLNN